MSIFESAEGRGLPFADESFELVTARHPVGSDRGEIRRVLAPGGAYIAQHVGPASAFELIERFLDPLVNARTSVRDATRFGSLLRRERLAWSSPSCVQHGAA